MHGSEGERGVTLTPRSASYYRRWQELTDPRWGARLRRTRAEE